MTRPRAAAAQAGTTRRSGDPTELRLTELVAQVRAGTLPPAQVVEAYLSRGERLAPELAAFITVLPDEARRRARDMTARAARAHPLAAAPLVHKDLFETAGVRTTAGSRLYEHHVPDRDATVVDRLTRAGAITLGKTNTHELGGGVTTINPFFGTTRNPRDVARIAGGSSGGSAVAVAARLAVAATGTDTGGSIRIPAAFCGCVGFKPTYGLLSTAGVLGASPTFDHAGFLTRDVADLIPLLQAAMGVDPRDSSTVPALPLPSAAPASLREVRVGVARPFFFDALAPEVERAVERTLSRLAAAGARLQEVRLPIDAGTMAEVFDPIVVAEIHQTYERDWRQHPERFSADFAAFFAAPLPATLALAAAYRARRTFQSAIARLFDAIDVLITPTVPIVAPIIESRIDGALILRNTWPFNAAHAPALSLPCHDADSLPVGLQLVGRPFDDARVLRIGMLLEMAQ